MKVFLSWSGERSNKCALALKEWLPNVIQVLEPWMSTEDVQKGAPWLLQINESLGQAQGIGIFCVTPENVRAPWLAFEAGHLAAAGGQARVCVVAVGMDVAEIPAPFSLFQATKVEADDFKRLIVSLNENTERPLNPQVLDKAFVTHWPSLLAELSSIAMAAPSEPIAPKRSQHELLSELIETSRRIEASLASLDHNQVQKPVAGLQRIRQRFEDPPKEPSSSSVDAVKAFMLAASDADLTTLARHGKEELIELGMRMIREDSNLTPRQLDVLRQRVQFIRAIE